MNIVSLFRAVETLIAFGDAARRMRRPADAPDSSPPPAAAQGLAGQIEARLTNVVVAALKEAFDRDHARLELERTHLEEERRRADAALRLERQRQDAEREVARLRLLAGASMIGWIASVALAAAGFEEATLAARITLAAGWIMLLAALGAAFLAQGRVGTLTRDDGSERGGTGAATASLVMLLAGLAATAISLVL